MSTILEALKKSEEERNRNEVPRLVDSPLPPERSIWPWIVVAVLMMVIAAGVTLFWWVTSQDGRASSIRGSAPASLGQIESVDASHSGVQSTSNFVLSVLSFTENPDSRFAIVNETLLREGDYLQAGVKVVQIEVDKVVIDQRGKRIELTP